MLTFAAPDAPPQRLKDAMWGQGGGCDLLSLSCSDYQTTHTDQTLFCTEAEANDWNWWNRGCSDDLLTKLQCSFTSENGCYIYTPMTSCSDTSQNPSQPGYVNFFYELFGTTSKCLNSAAGKDIVYSTYSGGTSYTVRGPSIVLSGVTQCIFSNTFLLAFEYSSYVLPMTSCATSAGKQGYLLAYVDGKACIVGSSGSFTQ